MPAFNVSRYDEGVPKGGADSSIGYPQVRSIEGRARSRKEEGHRAGRKDHQRVHYYPGLHVCSPHILLIVPLTAIYVTSTLADQPRSAEFPEDNVSILQTDDKITVEADGEVKTQ